jgi:preprotein translocase subunit YajC
MGLEEDLQPNFFDILLIFVMVGLMFYFFGDSM